MCLSKHTYTHTNTDIQTKVGSNHDLLDDYRKAVLQKQVKSQGYPLPIKGVQDFLASPEGEKTVEEVFNYILNEIVGGQVQQAKVQATSIESFFHQCCQIAMAMSEGEELTMMELCRLCRDVAEVLLETGKGMTPDQFSQFCCNVAKAVTGGSTANMQEAKDIMKYLWHG